MIRLLLANQSARKELVPGKIAANITGRVSLGVSEPIEAEIALPETGIKVNLVSQPGEFYSIMNGPTNPEHGNSPYIPQKVANVLNDKLTEKFGQGKYVKTRDQVMEETGFAKKDDDKTSSTSSDDKPSALSRMQARNQARPNRFHSTRPNAVPFHGKSAGHVTAHNASSSVKEPDTPVTVDTPLNDIAKLANTGYIPYLKAHMDAITKNKELQEPDEQKRKQAMSLATGIQEKIRRYDQIQKEHAYGFKS